MKNILLIGDSIRAGYDKTVKQALEGKANVVFPEENNRFASFLFRYIQDYKKLADGGDIDVIHWNAGLHDVLRIAEDEPQTPIEIYVYYIDRICVRIKKAYPNAKVIFATTTLVQSDKMSGGWMRKNEDITAYNAAAVEVVKKHGFEVNDLCALSASLPEDAHSDPTHYYTPIATEAFTNRVLEVVCKAAEIEDVPRYTENA